MFMISRYASTNLLRTSVSARNDTFAFCISSITWGSSTPGTPRSNLFARSLALSCVEFTLSRPCFMSFAKPLSTPVTPPLAAGPAAPARADCEMLRICASTRSISIWLMAWSSGLLSGCGNVDAGVADARELVTQRARADAELLRHFAARAMRGAQRLEDHVAFGTFERVGERRATGHGGIETRRLLLEQDVFGFDDGTFHEHERALQQVVELAHVAGPRVREQQVGGVGRQRGDALRQARALLQQVRRERQDVVTTFAQRVEREGEYVEPVIKIFAEPAGGHFRAQQAIGG